MHQGREFIAIGALENGAFCTVFSENFHKFQPQLQYSIFYSMTVYVSTVQNFKILVQKFQSFVQCFNKQKNCIFNESCALHCWNLSALALLHSDKGMVMCYFKWSGVLAIRTMQCIPMLFLYNTLHLYYTPVGLLARLLILLPYVDPVCRLR